MTGSSATVPLPGRLSTSSHGHRCAPRRARLSAASTIIGIRKVVGAPVAMQSASCLLLTLESHRKVNLIAGSILYLQSFTRPRENTGRACPVTSSNSFNELLIQMPGIAIRECAYALIRAGLERAALDKDPVADVSAGAVSTGTCASSHAERSFSRRDTS